jgi:hypothetical protein
VLLLLERQLERPLLVLPLLELLLLVLPLLELQ